MTTEMSKDELKRLVCQRIDEHAESIVEISRTVQADPETGFREFRTASLVEEKLRGLRLEPRVGLARTGVKATMKGGGDGPTVAILGELDSLIESDHPLANPTTNAAHACGHHAQIASMLGAAVGLQPVMDQLDGDVALMAVPAEECIELDWRQELIEQGEIEFLVGKAELIRLGEFDDVDIAMLTHTEVGNGIHGSVGDSHNGALVKRAKFTGVSAHAGDAPWKGVNALKAATLALTAIDAQRELFPEESTVRVHPIITHGGDVVTAVPSDVRVEMLVRARSIEAMIEVSAMVERALQAGALAVGAAVTIETTPAYLPSVQDVNLTALAESNIEMIVGSANLGVPRKRTGSTDMGELAQLMPTVQPRAGGAGGGLHSSDYVVDDHHLAAVNPAKSMAMTVIDLLVNGAAEAKRVISAAEGNLITKEQYLTLRRSMNRVATHDAVPL